MDRKLAIIFVFSLLIFGIITVNVKARATIEQRCTAASFCSNDYQLTCQREQDGYCPENFSDWNFCQDNAFGSKCFPCDKDCDECGAVSIYNVPNCLEPGASVSPWVIAYDVAIPSQHALLLYEGDTATSPTLAEFQCTTSSTTNSVCFHEFTDVDSVPNIGGKNYDYTATTNQLINDPWGVVTLEGYTAPKITIQYPEDGDTVSGSFDIEVIAESTFEIEYVEVYMKKWNEDFNAFRPVYLQDNQGDCSLRCEGSNCNRLGRIEGDEEGGEEGEEEVYEFQWDTTKCDNKDFEITVVAKDLGEDSCSNTAVIQVTTDNIGAPCVDECPEFERGVFESIIARIKTFI